jgi:hypothetical protein
MAGSDTGCIKGSERNVANSQVAVVEILGNHALFMIANIHDLKRQADCPYVDPEL